MDRSVYCGTFKINGFTDSHTECDRCGKTSLKGTFNIETEYGDIFHLGSDCIKSAWQMNQKDVDSMWFAPYKKRVSIAKDEFYSFLDKLIDRNEIDVKRKQIASKYGIKSEYEI